MAKDTFNILFLGGAKRVSMARRFKEAGARRGLDIRIFGSEISDEVPLSVEGPIIDHTRWSEPGALTHMLDICQRYDIRLVVPFVDNAVGMAAEIAAATAGKVFAPASGEEVAEAMFDKVLSAKAFEKQGIPVPPTWCQGTSISDILPLIAKPRHGSASKGILLIDKEEQLENLNVTDYLIQKRYDHRREITIDCYRSMLDGKIKAIVPRVRNEVAGGEVVRTTTFHDKAVTQLATEVIVKMDLRGAITVQLILDLETGRLMVMEVNPRLGGGSVAAVSAGADLPGMIIDEALGRVAEPSQDYRDVVVARYLEDVTFDVK